MSIMVTEVYQALVDAGASEEKARAAAEAIPDMSDLAQLYRLRIGESGK